MDSSVEVGLRAAQRTEPRMLIDGELAGSISGEEFDNVSPATGRLRGNTAAANAEDMDQAISAARRAFDETDWSTNRALRKRCLEQLQAALESDKENLREELIAEVGCPAMTTQSAQPDWPLAEALRYPGEPIDDFEWERVLDGGGLFGERNIRTVVKEPVGVVPAIARPTFRSRSSSTNSVRPWRPATPSSSIRPEHTVERNEAGTLGRRAHRHPCGCRERRADAVE